MTIDAEENRKRRKVDLECPNVPEKGSEFISERKLGLIAYVSKGNPGFHGIIKHRYEDFRVNEITLDETVVCVSESSNENESAQVEAMKEKEAAEHKESESEILAGKEETELWPVLEEFFEMESLEDLKKWLHQLRHVPHKDREAWAVDPEKYVLSRPIADKDTRTKVHKLMADFLGRYFETSTTKESCIGVMYLSNSAFKKRNTTGPKLNFLRFHLYKENMETFSAISKIARILKVDPKSFTFAGTKDKRAVTVQQVTVKRMPISRLMGINKVLDNMKISNPKFVESPLRMGQIWGNRFCIALRKVSADQEIVSRAMESLKQDGFINYFGMQRFGVCEQVSTHDIGVKILQGKWKEAVHLIMSPKTALDCESTTKARDLFFQGKYSEARDLMPGKQIAECRILDYFVNQEKHGHNLETEGMYLNAINSVPWSLRQMYVHAFQSYIWNHMVTERLEEHGFKPMIGDLVADKDFKWTEDWETVDDQLICLKNEQDLAKYSIDQVVLPLPGFKIEYPENDMKDRFSKCLAQYGLTFDSFRSNNRLTNLPGSYRRVLVKPKNMNWNFVSYNESLEETQPLINTAFDTDEKNNEIVAKDHDSLAIIVEFSLPSSSYATMAMREALKCSTTVSYQKSLSNTQQ